MSKITLCARFNLFPDDTVLGAIFSHSGFNFSSKGGTPIMVNETSGEKGITIPSPGISVELITLVNNVNFRVGIWDGNSIKVTARDENGAFITDKIVIGHNVYIDSFISGENIKSVDFDTIGAEEMLVSICIAIF